MKALIAAVALTAATHVSAQCVGTGSFRTCTDPGSGNAYSISELGNSTTTQGVNPRTGSMWNQTTTRIGSQTWTTGRDAQGRSWNANSFGTDAYRITNGRDANGRRFSCTTTAFGTTCN